METKGDKNVHEELLHQPVNSDNIRETEDKDGLLF